MKFGRRNTIIPSYIFPIYTPQNPPPENLRRSSSEVTSNQESSTSSPPKKKRKKSPTRFPNPTGNEDPETRKKAFRRWMASMGPEWSPCPPTACDSFLHEIPAGGKIAVNEKVPADGKITVNEKAPAQNDLAARFHRLIQEGLSSAIMPERESKPNNNMKIHVYDKAAVDDMVIGLERHDRNCRRNDAEAFRGSYTYGCNDTMEQKTCIMSSGTYTWMEKSSGIMWVAVHGMNSICLVTRNEALDETRLGNYLKACKQHVCCRFRETLISEMEDLADPSSEACQNIHQSIDKPFAVVSLIPAGTNKANEESGTEASEGVYDDKGAINFLLEKMKSRSTLTYGYSETLQMAISAFLLLFDKKLKAKDIKVTVWAKGHGSKDLWIRDAGENLVIMYRKGIETLVERSPK